MRNDAESVGLVAGKWKKRNGNLLTGDPGGDLARLRGSGVKISRAMGIST